MGINIKLNDAEFEDYFGYVVYPPNDNLTNLYLFGDDLDESCKDMSGNSRTLSKLQGGSYIGWTFDNDFVVSLAQETSGANYLTMPNKITSVTHFSAVIACSPKQERALLSTIGLSDLSGIELSTKRVLLPASTQSTTEIHILSTLRDNSISATDDDILVYGVVFDGNTVKIYVPNLDTFEPEELNTFTQEGGYYCNSNTVAIGNGLRNLTNSGQAQLGCIALYDKTLNNDELKSTFNYLCNKYKLNGYNLL